MRMLIAWQYGHMHSSHTKIYPAPKILTKEPIKKYCQPTPEAKADNHQVRTSGSHKQPSSKCKFDPIMLNLTIAAFFFNYFKHDRGNLLDIVWEV